LLLPHSSSFVFLATSLQSVAKNPTAANIRLACWSATVRFVMLFVIKKQKDTPKLLAGNRSCRTLLASGRLHSQRLAMVRYFIAVILPN
ncbi:MAG: hypothetical protein KAT68_17500, partial [Bacteroidales bacterium]|nr:hypothetical protein [Bacteroidales bacterium]